MALLRTNDVLAVLRRRDSSTEKDYEEVGAESADVEGEEDHEEY